MLLAGDIGGTKTALGIFSEEQGSHTALAEAEVHSADYRQPGGDRQRVPGKDRTKGGPRVFRRCRAGDGRAARKSRTCPGSSTRHALQRS